MSDRPNVVYFPAFDNGDNLQQQLARAIWYLSPIAPARVSMHSRFEPSEPKAGMYTPEVERAISGAHPDWLHLTDKPISHEELIAADAILLWKGRKPLESLGDKLMAGLAKAKVRLFDVNCADRTEGSKYIDVSHRLANNDKTVLAASQEKFANLAQETADAGTAFLFCSGPEVQRYPRFDFSDGIRISCNSVINDEELLEAAPPDIQIFGDPIFHFGCSAYANEFRLRLKATHDQYGFKNIVPIKYWNLFTHWQPDLIDQSMAVGFDTKLDINLDLLDNFCLHTTDNILTFLMLPVGATLANRIYLLGCDGRPLKQDDYFWKHNEKTQFVDQMENIKEVHPSFFTVDYKDYYERHLSNVAAYFSVGDGLGKSFCALTPSHIPAIRSREHTLARCASDTLVVAIEPIMQGDQLDAALAFYDRPLDEIKVFCNPQANCAWGHTLFSGSLNEFDLELERLRRELEINKVPTELVQRFGTVETADAISKCAEFEGLQKRVVLTKAPSSEQQNTLRDLLEKDDLEIWAENQSIVSNLSDCNIKILRNDDFSRTTQDGSAAQTPTKPGSGIGTPSEEQGQPATTRFALADLAYSIEKQKFDAAMASRGTERLVASINQKIEKADFDGRFAQIDASVADAKQQQAAQEEKLQALEEQSEENATWLENSVRSELQSSLSRIEEHSAEAYSRFDQKIQSLQTNTITKAGLNAGISELRQELVSSQQLQAQQLETLIGDAEQQRGIKEELETSLSCLHETVSEYQDNLANELKARAFANSETDQRIKQLEQRFEQHRATLERELEARTGQLEDRDQRVQMLAGRIEEHHRLINEEVEDKALNKAATAAQLKKLEQSLTSKLGSLEKTVQESHASNLQSTLAAEQSINSALEIKLAQQEVRSRIDYLVNETKGLISQTDSIATQQKQQSDTIGQLQKLRTNQPDFQYFSRHLEKDELTKLSQLAKNSFGVDLAPRSIAYLAHRMATIENMCVGRLATSLHAALVRAMAVLSLPRAQLSYLEIGALFGINMAITWDLLRYRFKKVQLTCIDPFDGYYGDETPDTLTGIPITQDVLKQNLKRFASNMTNFDIIVGRSEAPDIVRKARRREFNLVLVDGDHSYEGVKHDFETYSQLTARGGLIIIDDYGAHEWPEVTAYADKGIIGNPDYEVLSDSYRTLVVRKL